MSDVKCKMSNVKKTNLIMKKLLKILTIIPPLQRGLGGFVLFLLSTVYCLLPIDSLAGNNIEFIENRGQIVDMKANLRSDILYVGDGGGAKIYLRKGMVSYVMTVIEGLDEEELEEAEEAQDMEKYNSLLANAILKVHRVDMEFVNANMDAKVRVEEPTQGYFNYYLGHCPEGITGVKAHRKVVYENMYPNIDVVFYGGKDNPPLSPLRGGDFEGMEYDFVVKLGADVEDIRLRYKGADGIEVEDGKLKIKTSFGDMIEEIPEVYQIINGEKIKIEAAYVLKGNEVKIIVGDYDKSKVLIIDPWITYYGGSRNDRGFGTATDGSGNVVVTGSTQSADFPVSIGAFQDTLRALGRTDAFVVKFNAAGNLLWATYYGGSTGGSNWGMDISKDIAIDGKGNVVITGHTESIDFPVTPGAFQTSYGGGWYDAFVVKFNAAGNRLWATYYGGQGNENGRNNGSIATDGSDNVLITGWTSGGGNFPVTAGAFQTGLAGIGNFDAFIVKFDSSGNRLWATYYGGSDDDMGLGIATDGSDNVLITGQTASVDFPFTPGAFQTSYGGGGGFSPSDAFVVKLDSSGQPLWATYYGRSGDDRGFGIATAGAWAFAVSSRQ